MKNVFHRLFRIGEPGKVPDDATPLLRWGIGLVVIFIGGGLVFMGLAPLEGAIVGEGLVKARTDRVAVMHPKGGVLSELHIKDGDVVGAGQPLMEITEPARLAAFEATRYTHDSELARNSRLRSEQLLADAVRFPPTLKARKTEPAVSEIMAQEAKVFQNRRGTLIAAESAMKREAALIGKETVHLAGRVVQQKEATAATSEQLIANQGLVEKGFISRARILDLKRAQAVDMASVGELEGDRLRADQRIAELDLRLAEMKNRFFETVSQELKSSDERLFQLEQQLAAQRVEVQRDVVAAPVDGAVINLRPISKGSVIAPLQPLLEIVPAGDTLFVEAPVAPKDVRYIKIGERAELQVAGWNRRTMPMLEGQVEYVSPDALKLANDRVAFVVRVKIGKATGPGIVEPLKPGMQTIVYLRTGPRTLLDFMLEPVIDSMRSAFRAPS
jgi:HlyD family type I secretion membrane fusion protein